MSLPVVAIVGRPNVGKSALFNYLAGRRISIVEPTAGVTRDRVSTPIDAGDRHFELVDTGGMGIQDRDNLTADVEQQITFALNAAAVVLFVVDVRVGIAPLDQTVAERLRSVGKPVVFVANKADDPKFLAAAADLFRLGYGAPLLVSAEQKIGKAELIDEILHHLPEGGDTAAPKAADLKIALVGRRNVGKSTFINSLAQDDRVIVSEVAGTTRDSIDVRFERDGQTIVAIDTAGVRKKSSIADSIEFYSAHRAERSIRRADVVLHLFDPRPKISRVDKQLADYILKHERPAIFVVNKWDLAKDLIPTEKWGEYLRKTFPMLDHVPIAFTSANSGRNVYRLLNLCQELHKQAHRRMKTGDLNRVIRDAMTAMTAPVRFNRVPKVFYAAQVASAPPTVVMVTNGPDLFDNTYVKYLTKTIRDASPFPEVAIKVVMRSKADASGRGGAHDAHDEAVAAAAAADGVELPPDEIAVDESGAPLEPVVIAASEPKARKPVRKKKKKPGPGTWKL